MPSGTAIRLPAEWEDRIEVFEAAAAHDSCADFERFLPPEHHPLRLAVLAELVRIDLEYSWRRAAPRRLEDYQPLFPQLFADPELLRSVAFEEYRLRRQAGEEPTPAEYQERIGMPIGLWPRPKHRPAGTSPPACEPSK